MERYVEAFTKQLQEAISIGIESKFRITEKPIKNVVISGLGGSGIGGKIVAQLNENELRVPVKINNTYDLPAFADKNTLVIISSYSGNTEETVFVLNEAIKRGCEIACVTSGGTVLNVSKNNHLNHILIPGGNPPRAMLPYSLVQLFFILNHYKLIGDNFKHSLLKSIELIQEENEKIKQEAMKIAENILGKTLIIYSESSISAVATRFKQQINENAKALCWDNVIPEMNHNELVGWAGGTKDFAVIFLENDSDFDRNKVRAKVSKEIINKYTDTIITIQSKGNDIIQKAIYLIYFTDWISVYLGNLKQVDTIEVDVITGLKEELSKL